MEGPVFFEPEGAAARMTREELMALVHRLGREVTSMLAAEFGEEMRCSFALILTSGTLNAIDTPLEQEPLAALLAINAILMKLDLATVMRDDKANH